MRKSRNIFRETLLSFFMFLLGLLFEPIFGRFVTQNVDPSHWAFLTPFGIAICTLAFVSIAYWTAVHRNLSSDIRAFSKESLVVAEPDFETIENQSLCYSKLHDMVLNAQKSIFVIPNPYREGEIDSWEKLPRKDYLRTIESVVKRKQGDPGFEYIRIQQVPKSCKCVRSQIGESAAAHISRLKKTPSERVRLLQVDVDEISGQLIIDGETLVKFISGVDSKGKKRLIAIAIMRDPHTDSIGRYYARLKQTLLERAKPIDFPQPQEA